MAKVQSVVYGRFEVREIARWRAPPSPKPGG